MRELLQRLERELGIRHICGQTVHPLALPMNDIGRGMSLASILTDEQSAALDATNVQIEFTQPTNWHHFGRTWEVFTLLTDGRIQYRCKTSNMPMPYSAGTTILIPPPVVRKVVPYYANSLIAHVLTRPKYDERDEISDD